MPEEHCFVCASDEGIFLDIFTHSKNYRENIETCLSLKLKKKNMQSNKICHKCVYELDQCSKFVKKYKKTHQVKKGKLFNKRGFCCLCMEAGKKGYIFDLWNEDRLDNSIEKLQDLFEVDCLTEDLYNLSICLDCRYNLDVLFDLKYLFKDTSRCFVDNTNDGITPEVPKINTCVVRRSTTLTRMPKLSQSKSSLAESDASTVIIDSTVQESGSIAMKSNLNERKCDKCDAKIENGKATYRYHGTDNTVCKMCWLTMDPCERAKNKSRKSNKAIKTQLCSVFLKDVLETEKKDLKDLKKIEDDCIYIISSDESEMDDNKKILSARSTPRKRKKPVTETKPSKKFKTEYTKNTRLTRSSSVQTLNKTNQRNIRQTRSDSAETAAIENKIKNLRKRSEVITESVASSSNYVGEKLSETRRQAVKMRKRKVNKSNLSSSSEEIEISLKLRKDSSSSYKIELNESNNESDSDNSRPYTCKICFATYENKIVGLTHQLTHSKKLEVLLEKVSLPENMEDNIIDQKPPSPEFHSPTHSKGEHIDLTSDLHAVVADDSSLLQFPAISKDDNNKDKQNENSEVSTISKCNEVQDPEDNNKKRESEDQVNGEEEKEGEKEKRIEDTEGGVETEEMKKDEDGIEIENEDKEQVEKNKDKEKNEGVHTSFSSPSIEVLDDIENNETLNNNVEEERPMDIISSNISYSETKPDENEMIENVDNNENGIKISTEKNSKDPEMEIANMENDVCVAEENTEKISDSGMESILQNEFVVNNYEKLTSDNSVQDEKNEIKEKEAESFDKEQDANENNDVERIEPKQINNEGEEHVEIETPENLEENNCREPTTNGNNDEQLPHNDAIGNDDNKNEVYTPDPTECDKESNKSEECSGIAASDTGNGIELVSKEESKNETPQFPEAETSVADTEINNINENSNRTESIEIEKRLAEMMGENEA